MDSAMLAVADIFRQGYCPKMPDQALAKLWVTVRLAVPRLVVRALDGDEEAVTILVATRQYLDPSIEVPWRSLPSVTQEQLNEPPDGADGYAFIARLRRLWDEAMARAKAM